MGTNKPNLTEMAAYVCAALVIYFWLSWHVFTNAQSTQATPNWTQPTAISLKRVSDLPAAQSATVAFPNIKCSLNGYRYSTDNTMYSGCFSDSAYGLFDVGSQAMIFNGTDEALPILPFSSHQTLIPWPGAEFLSVDPAPYSGSYLTLYTNPLSALSDKRNLLLLLEAKQLNAPPNLSLKDQNGQRLRVNSQTLSFSDSGAWLVVESEDQSFIRINLSTLQIKPFTPNYVYNGNVNQPSQIAVSDSGRYIAIFNNPASEFRVYDLNSCPIISKNLEPEYCPYHDYLSFVKKQIPTAVSIKNISFINENLISFEIIASKSEDSGIYELAPSDGIENLMEYLGLGDSYTSGEGAFNYRDGTDTPENICHLSTNSYPLLISRDLYGDRGGNSVACSGAVIQDVGSTDEKYRGQVRGVLDFAHLKTEQPQLLSSVMTNFVPGYVAQQRFIGLYTPNIVTVSIGGNDVGFGDLLESCVTARATRHASDNDCFSTFEDRQEVINLIDRKVATWTKLFRDLKSKSPASSIVAIGYPQVADDRGSCGLNVNLSRIELELSVEIIKYINSSIQKSANNAGVGYIDIGDALDGHKLCQASSYNVAVNGLTAGKDGGVFGLQVLGKESYHPNELGHQLIERAILTKSKNFSLFLNQPTQPNSSKLLTAPKSGRQIRSRTPSSITTKAIKKGSTVKINTSGKNAGLKPNTSYKVIVGKVTDNPVSTVTSGPDGDIESSITIPPNQPSGGQEIHIIGEGSGGQVDVTQPVYVPASDSDYDDDGIENSQDSCPYIVNSDKDDDHDLIDDACDPLIASSGSNGSTNTNSNSGINSQVSTSVSMAHAGSDSNVQSSSSGQTSNKPELKVNKSLSSVARDVSRRNIKPNKKQTFNEIHGENHKHRLKNLSINMGLIKISLNLWLWLVVLAWIIIIIILYYREDREQNTKYELAR